jgi:dTMP kinase
MARGIYINFEGPECGGKGTQLKRAFAYLQAHSIQYETAREPGGTPVGEMCRLILKQPQTAYDTLAGTLGIRQDWFNAKLTVDATISNQSELMLFLASRGNYFEHIVKPKLEAGISIVGDRGPDSTFVYQGWTRFRGNPKVLDFIQRANAFVMQGMMPDCTFLLDLPIEETIKRMKDNRPEAELDRFEQEATLDFFQSIRDGYLECARRNPERIVIIDASVAEEDVWAQIMPPPRQTVCQPPHTLSCGAFILLDFILVAITAQTR